MLTVRITGLDRAISRTRTLAPRVHAALRAEVEKQAIELQAHIVGQKLSGQVLQVRTGTLRRSITYRVTETTGQLSAVVGTNVEYARIHEYGGTIHVPELRPVRAKALRFMAGGNVVFAMRTRAHDVQMPERSFLRSSLRERAGAIAAGIRDAIARVVHGQ